MLQTHSDTQAVAVVQRAMRQADPADVMAELGFGEVELVSSFAVSMSGLPASIADNSMIVILPMTLSSMGWARTMTGAAFPGRNRCEQGLSFMLGSGNLHTKSM